MQKGRLPLTLFLVISVQTLATLAVLSLSTLAPVVSESFRVSASYVGYQVSIIYISGSALSLVAGALVKKFGAVIVSQYALFFCLTGLLSFTLNSLLLTLCGSLLIGAGYGLTNPAASHLLSKVTPARHRNFIFSLKQTAVPLGGVLAGFLLPAITTLYGWRAAIVTAASLCLLLILFLTIHRKSLDSDRDGRQRLGNSIVRDIGQLRGRKDLLYLAVTAFCFSAIQLSLMTFTVNLIVHDLSKTIIIAGWVISLMHFSGVLGRIFWGSFADHYSSGTTTLRVIGMLSLVSSLLLSTVTSQWNFSLVIALLCLFGMCSIGWNGVFLAEVVRMSRPDEIGSMTGMALVFTFAGVVIGPSLFAFLHSYTGSYAHTFGYMAIFPLLGIMSLFRLQRYDTLATKTES